jgi:TrpR family transcriptional regulator, trp operon repressor
MDDLEKKGWEGFLQLCANIQSPETLKEVFDLFFTLEEKETFAARYLVVKALLDSKLSQREIASELKVSIAQITRGSNALKIISPKLKRQLQNYCAS